MDQYSMMMVALFYVSLQGLVLFRFDGVWRFAAVMPVPLLCATLILAVAGGLFGLPGSEIVALVALPVGLCYLVLLVLFAQIARMLRPTAT